MTRLQFLAALIVVVLGASACGSTSTSEVGDQTTTSSSQPLPAEAMPLPRQDPLGPDGCIDLTDETSWPLERLAAQTLMIGVSPSDLSSAVDTVESGVGGIFIGGNDMTLFGSPLRELRTSVSIEPLVAVDEEGGRVQRVDTVSGGWPSAREAALTLSVDDFREEATLIAATMADLGVTMNLGPVLDLNEGPASGVIGDRSYSSDPAVVTPFGRAFIDAMHAHDIGVVVKHFPGHGRASGDTHLGAASTPPVDELAASDWLPYEELATPAGAVMLAHVSTPGLNDDLPASLSPDVVEALRTRLGFEGMIMTDDIEAMAAIGDRWSVPRATVQALSAGVDLVLAISPRFLSETIGTVVAAVDDGSLSRARLEDAAGRVLAYKSHSVCEEGAK